MGSLGLLGLTVTGPLITRSLAAGQTRLPTLADLWLGTASFKPQAGTYGAEFGMHFVSTQWVNGTLYAYYIAPGFEIGLATSRDGVRFQNRGTVIRKGPSEWDSNMASFPGIRYDGSRWYCVYEGSGKPGKWPGDIGLATSADGLRWTKLSSPILRHEGGWERQNIGTPSLWKEGATWYLFYHGFGKRSGSPDDCQVGLAFGSDLQRLNRFRGNPVLPTSSAGFDSGTVGRRSVIREGAYYYMVYEASTEQPYDRARWTSGLARSRDLLTWEKFPRNIIPQTQRGFGFDGPEFVRLPNGTLALYFRDPGGATKRALLSWNPGR